MNHNLRILLALAVVGNIACLSSLYGAAAAAALEPVVIQTQPGDEDDMLFGDSTAGEPSITPRARLAQNKTPLEITAQFEGKPIHLKVPNESTVQEAMTAIVSTLNESVSKSGGKKYDAGDFNFIINGKELTYDNSHWGPLFLHHILKLAKDKTIYLYRKPAAAA